MRKSAARKLADLGYVAYALDIYGERTATGREDHAMKLCSMASLPEPGCGICGCSRGLAQLKAQPNVDTARLAAIGFCFGGMTVLELVRVTNGR